MAEGDAAPAPSAEARRLIDDLRSKQRLHHPRHNAPAWFEEPKRQAVDAADRALSAYVAGLEAALVEIRDMDWVEACLDPQWARRRAHAAITAQRGRAAE